MSTSNTLSNLINGGIGVGTTNVYGYQEIEVQTLTGNATSITFANIDQSYDDLQIVITGRTDRAALGDSANIEFNGDGTALNYFLQNNYSDNGSNNSAEATSFQAVALMPSATADAGAFSNSIVNIFDYTGSNLKSVWSVNGHIITAGAQGLVGNRVIGWDDNSPITDIVFTPAEGTNFVSGCTFRLLGRKNISIAAPGSETILAQKVLKSELLTGTQASVTFNNIDQSYKRLIIKGRVRTERVSTGDGLGITINSDAGTTYWRQNLEASNGAINVAETQNNNLMTTSAGSSPAGAFTTFEIVIEGYADSIYKNIHIKSSTYNTTDSSVTNLRSIIWRSTAAITSIVLDSVNSELLSIDSSFEFIGEKEITVNTQPDVVKHITSGSESSVSIDVSVLSGDSLEFEFFGRSDNTSNQIQLTFNSDNGNNYDAAFIGLSATGVDVGSSADGAGKAFIRMPSINTSSGLANAPSQIIGKIAQFKNTTFFKTVNCQGGTTDDATPVDADILQYISSGQWRSLSPINTIDFTLVGANFVDGSIITVRAK